MLSNLLLVVKIIAYVDNLAVPIQAQSAEGRKI